MVLRGALAEASGDGARFRSVPHFALCTAHFPKKKCMLPISSFGWDNEFTKSQSCGALLNVGRLRSEFSPAGAQVIAAVGAELVEFGDFVLALRAGWLQVALAVGAEIEPRAH